MKDGDNLDITLSNLNRFIYEQQLRLTRLKAILESLNKQHEMAADIASAQAQIAESSKCFNDQALKNYHRNKDVRVDRTTQNNVEEKINKLNEKFAKVNKSSLPTLIEEIELTSNNLKELLELEKNIIDLTEIKNNSMATLEELKEKNEVDEGLKLTMKLADDTEALHSAIGSTAQNSVYKSLLAQDNIASKHGSASSSRVIADKTTTLQSVDDVPPGRKAKVATTASKPNLKDEFLTKYNKQLNEDKSSWCGMYGFFTTSKVNNDMSLEDLVKHAQNNTTTLGFKNRSYKVMKDMGWIDDDGNLSDVIQTAIKPK